ncbi:MAG: alpha/beta fold hydrolase [Thermodesulfobacteriota bacterium]
MGYSIKKPPADKSIGECVVLLHGMGRRYHSMSDMQERLLAAGYHTVNAGYPSTRASVESIVADCFMPALTRCRNSSPKPTAIHFVTHSLGGIVVRKGILENRPPELGRVVMLSPPNRGSALVDTLRDWKMYQWLNGPAGQQLSTAPDSVPNQLGPVDYPVGVITGDRYAFFDAWFSHVIPGEDDGKVSVERARLEGMSDFLVVHASHPFIMDSDYVQDETVHFLKHGSFKHRQEPLPPVSGGDWFSFPSK